MSTVINIKYSLATNQPADDLLTQAELAYSYSSDKLFIGYDNGTNIVPQVIGGKYFTDMLDHTHGTLTASSAIIVDADSKIDVLNVDNLTLDGNTLSSTNTNGGITIDPNGTGEITLGANTTVQGTLTVSGAMDFNAQVSANSLNVEDLTSGRVVLAGTNGELQDAAGFTYTTSSGGETDVNITGSLSVDNVDIDGNDISTTNTNGNLTLTPNGTGLVVVNKATGFKVASGTEAARPSAGSVGDAVIRYNETTNRFEGTVSGSWTGLGGVVDIDQDTYIDAEASADEDVLRFYTGNTGGYTAGERLRISGAGAVFASDIGITANAGIDVDDINIDGDTITINGSTIQGTGNSALGTIILDPAPAAGDNGGTLVVRGNLQVTGTQTIVNSTVVTVDDPIMVLGQDDIGDTLDRGIQVLYNTATPVAATSIVNGQEYTIVSAGDTDFTAIGAADSNVGTVFTATGSGTGTGTAVTTSTETSGFFGYDRGVDNVFTWLPDTNVTNPTAGDAKFGDLYLEGSIKTIGDSAATAGQLLIGNATTGELELSTLTAGDSITITNGDGSIEIDVDAAEAVATTDITDTGDGVVNYAPASGNAGSRGAATFASEQFNVSSGHVVITRIEGGTF
jgi:hypothetical protein